MTGQVSHPLFYRFEVLGFMGKRYPSPRTVMMCLGFCLSSSILPRSRLM